MPVDGILTEMLAMAAKVFLALYLGLSGVEKVRNLSRFTDAVAAYRLLPMHVIPTLAVLMVVAELLIAAALPFVGGTGPATMAAGLISLFTIAITINLLRGHVDIDCGCNLANRHEPLGWHLVLRNLLLVLVAWVAWGGKAASAVSQLSGAAAGTVAFLLLVAAQALRSIRLASTRI